MTRSEIIEQANTLTERRAERVLDLKILLAEGTQKFMREKRFWWRRKTLTFNSAPNVPLYDLSSADGGLPGATDLEEIITVIRFTSSSDYTELDPIFEPVNQELARLDTTLATDEPKEFLIEPGTYQTIRLSQIPNTARQYVVPYWAIPSRPTDDTDEAVPLVPSFLHYCLVDRLRMDIFLFLFGPESEKYAGAKAEYEMSLAQAEEKPSYSVKKALELRSNERAVRSTAR